VHEPEALKALQSRGKDTSIAGGGESRTALQKRVATAVEDLAFAHRGKKVLGLLTQRLLWLLFSFLACHF
jgi:broad specificity phosphatase PhoE